MKNTTAKKKTPSAVRTGLLIATGVGIGCWAAATAMRRRSSASLAGKVVLITGSSRGLGLALAEEFGRNGARLVLTARNESELKAAQRHLAARGMVADEDVTIFPCDLTDSKRTKEMIEAATGRWGRIDILVNDAGIITVGPVEDQPMSAFKDAMEANYYTALHTTMAVLPQMLKRRSGSIVNIASVGGKIAVPHLLPYSASKFAIVGFSQGLHAELQSKGIRVTTVCPGLMRTGSHIHALFTGDREREYRWFSLAASLPGFSIDASSAARKIVRATIAGSTEITITPQAFVAAAAAQLIPTYIAPLLGWVNSLVLPAPQQFSENELRPGNSVRGKELSLLTWLGNAATYRFNQRSQEEACAAGKRSTEVFIPPASAPEM